MQNVLNTAIVGFLILGGSNACSASPNKNTIEITNFKSGLVCLYKYEDDGSHKPDAHVCFETEDIHVTGQGRCVFDGNTKPCTWYGYEFEYENKSDAPVIMTCNFSSDRNSVHGNPEEILDEEVSSYETVLEPGQGKISNPQYTIYRTVQDGDQTRLITRCEVEGNTMFVSTLDVIIPASR